MAYPSPLVSMITQELPEYKRRMLASQMLMQQGPTQNPSRSPIEGLARMLTQIGGGFLANRVMQKDEAQRSEAGKLLSDALVGGTVGYQKKSAPWADVSGITPTVSQPQSRSQLLATLSGSENPYARQMGQGLTAQALMQGGGSETPESFGTPQTVMGPDGKPVLAQFGNRGTPRPISGFAPIPGAEKAGGPPVVKDFFEGGQVLQKQWDPESKSWTQVGGGPRWDPSGGSKVNVNVGAPSFTFPRPETEKAADTAFGKGIGEMAGTLVQDAPKRSQEMSKVNATESLLNHLETVGKAPGKYADVKNEMARSYYSLTGQKVPENVQDFRTFSSMANKDILNYIGAKQGGIPASGFSDRDMAVVKSIAASSADDPLTLKAKLAVQKASIKADDAFAKDVMDYRKTMPTEEATYKAMENAKSRDLLGNDPAVKRWAQGSAPPAAAGGAGGAGGAAPAGGRKFRFNPATGKLE